MICLADVSDEFSFFKKERMVDIFVAYTVLMLRLTDVFVTTGSSY